MTTRRRSAKARITIMLDRDVIDFFKTRAAERGAAPYQTQINRLLREEFEVRRVAERPASYPAARRTVPKRKPVAPAARPGGAPLERTIKAVIRPGHQSGYVAECFEVPVVTQGRTLDEVARNLREAVELHLSGEDLARLGLAPEPALLVTLELLAPHA